MNEDILAKIYCLIFLLNVSIWRWSQKGRLTWTEKYVILKNLYAVVNT